MPRKTPRHLQRSRTRLAIYTQRDDQAQNSLERFDNASRALRAALANSRGNAEHTAQTLTSQLRPQVTTLLGEAPRGRTRLYQDKLNQPGTWRQRLGNTLSCLKGACQLLPDADRDSYLNHYTTHLLQKAREIENEGR